MNKDDAVRSAVAFLSGGARLQRRTARFPCGCVNCGGEIPTGGKYFAIVDYDSTGKVVFHPTPHVKLIRSKQKILFRVCMECGDVNGTRSLHEDRC